MGCASGLGLTVPTYPSTVLIYALKALTLIICPYMPYDQQEHLAYLLAKQNNQLTLKHELSNSIILSLEPKGTMMK